MLYACLFPTSRTEFTHGLSNVDLKNLVLDAQTTLEGLKKITGHIQVWWSKAMHEVWTTSCEVLHDMGMDYASRMEWYIQQTEI
jgi:hypothetical protein